MSYIHVYIHFVWATKNRFPFLTEEIRRKVLDHIRENAQKKNIYIDFINAYLDHVHCLVSMNDDLSIGKIAQHLKGESSFWINKNKLTKGKFAWQNEYFAIGVGNERIAVTRKYIANQEEHHKKRNFADEYDEFIQEYGFGIVRKDFG